MYTEAQKRASIKYAQGKLKRIPLDVQADYFADVIKPAADRAGLPVNTWIKQAIAEKIERDQN